MKAVALSVALAVTAMAQTERVRNSRVVVTEYRVARGESVTAGGDLPALIVYPAGEVVFRAAHTPPFRYSASTEGNLVRIEFLGQGLDETWGPAGLSPNYKVLLENRFTRVYDIRIPAGTKEPQHTHHDRVVVCLSGAQLEHLMPDGRVEPSTLATGEIAWRRGGTHIGHNLGKTDLRVIAVEPK